MDATKTEPQAPGLALLRQPFAANHISKLPKPTKAQTDAVKADFKAGARCKICGSWHHPDVVHLDYVGHAALTDRLLDADPEWAWEPAALRDGLPAFDQSGGLWIKLTVCGVTRLGYGHAAAKPGQDPGAREKECIGDALRNAAMRFGAALDLWHKGDLHAPEEAESEAKEDPETTAAVITAKAAIGLAKTEDALAAWGKSNGPMIQSLPTEEAQAVRRHYALRQNALKRMVERYSAAATAEMPDETEIPY